MDFRSQPSRGSEPAPAPAPAPAAKSDHHPVIGRPSWASKVLVLLLIVAALLVIGTLGERLLAGPQADSAVKGKQYQAVFLTNGQVYFGHLSNIDGSYVKLRDIYYLQVQQQQASGTSAQQQQQQPQISLAKLGGELHGPEDSMFIDHSQVLFWENLKDDGKVAKAIQDYINQNKK